MAKPIFSIRYFKITTKIVLNIVVCFCKDIPVVTAINHKQSFFLSRKYSSIHEEVYLRTLAFASTAFLHNKIKLHFVTFYRSHCHFHHSTMYSENKAIKNNIIHSNFSNANLVMFTTINIYETILNKYYVRHISKICIYTEMTATTNFVLCQLGST